MSRLLEKTTNRGKEILSKVKKENNSLMKFKKGGTPIFIKKKK